ncbi:MAG: two component transcriptional regulator, LuxR family [Fibrobacteres bacterium]|nr:two component transcriptional regulator, LuxR family [Fibrobacterota bacterium]
MEDADHKEGKLEAEAGKPFPGIARILVVDDHPVVRQGLAMTLGRDPGLMICGETEGLKDTLAAVENLRPDLVLSDLDLDGLNGLDLIKAIRASHPQLPILILSMHDEELYAERALRAGARGYLMKNEPPDRLIAGIYAALKGEITLSEKIKAKILGNLAGHREGRKGLSVDRLTDRELEVFRLIGQGYTNRRISEKLSLSVKTIEAHCAHIKQKLGLNTGAELQYQAFQLNRDAGKDPG